MTIIAMTSRFTYLFEISPLGSSVTAHTGEATYGDPQLTLRHP